MNIRYKLLYIVIVIAVSLSSFHAYGQALYRENSKTRQTLHAVWFPTYSLGSAVGDSGALSVTFYAGNSWQIDPEPFLGSFNTIFFSDSANGAIAGDSGTIFISLGSNTPVKVTLPESNPIYGMTFPSYDTGVVCGANGLFYMTADSGKSWTKKTLMPQALQKITFYGTDYFDDDTYWIVGEDGLALYTEDDGKTWQRYPLPTAGTATTKTLYSIYFPSDGSATGWIVGDQCLFLTTDGGDDWTSIPTTDSLRFVAGWDSTDAYAVGLHGAILYTSDRTDWSSYPSGTTANLYGLDFPDSLFFVGDSGLILTTLPPIVQSPPAPIFEVEGDFSQPGSQLNFGNTPDGVGVVDAAHIINVSSVPVTIDSITCDSAEFTVNSGNATPFMLDAGASRQIVITFTPPISNTIHTYNSTLRVYSGDSEHNAPLAGVGEPTQGSVATPTATGSINILLTSGNRSTFINYPNDWIGPVRIEVFNTLGISVFSTDRVSDNTVNAMPGELPAGVYIYRFSGPSGSLLGKFFFY